MALNTNALITVDEYLVTIGSHDTPPTPPEKARYEQAINWASKQVEVYLDRTLMSGSTETEVFDGLGEPHPELLHSGYKTKQAPLITSPTPKLFQRTSSAWTAVTSTLYTYDATDGEIYFTDGSFFLAGRKNYKAVYDYGYANTAAIPDDLKWAASSLVHNFFNVAEHQGKASETIGTQTFSYNLDIPKFAKTILDAYKR